MVLGVVGAIAGGWGLGLVGISGNGGLVASFFVAVVGALAVIWISRKIGKA